MAGKRKAKTTKQEDLSKPTQWRLQHGGFGEPIREADPERAAPYSIAAPSTRWG